MSFTKFNIGESGPKFLKKKKSDWDIGSQPQNSTFRVSLFCLPGVAEGNDPVFEFDDGTPTQTEMKGWLDAFVPSLKRTILVDSNDVSRIENAIPKQEGRKNQKSVKQRVVFPAVFWPTDKNGSVSQARLENGEYEVVNVKFNLTNFEKLKKLIGEWPTSQVDFNITVTDPKFHSLEISPTRKSIMTTMMNKKSELFTEILGEIADCFNNINPPQAMSYDELIAELENAGSSNVGNPVSSSSASFGSIGDVDDFLSDIETDLDDGDFS